MKPERMRKRERKFTDESVNERAKKNKRQRRERKAIREAKRAT
ncbi:hypothetical protein [Vibrio fortis]|nr:hypothetical protein [Vibrio fortis]